jgi:hypothetical protein
MESCYLRFDKDFWTSRSRKTIFPAGTKFLYEVEIMSSHDGGDIKHYFVYTKPNVHIGYYEEDGFNELFMTKDELRDKKIYEII